MSLSSLYLGVDIGTTSTKSVLFAEAGKVLSMHHVEYPLHSPAPAIAEQDPEQIFQAVLETMKTAIKKAKVDTKNLKLVSFSSAMHSVIALDETGKPLTRCMGT